MSAHSPIRLSLAAPAYNEAQAIEAVIENWHRFLSARTDLADFEIVVCNDGSTDATGDILDRLTLSYPALRPMHFERNQGAAAALNAAIAATKGDWVMLIDSDGQFPVETFTAMMAALRQSGGLAAMGVRHKNDAAFARFGSWASGAVCNLVHGSRLKDFNSACKLVWGPTLRGLGLEAKSMNYSTEVTSKLLERGIVPVEVKMEHRPRAAGASHMKLLRGALHRFLFVAYIALRQLLLRLGILARRTP
ncbi:MAG TPA: glycosyltransferase family 2 protein [Rhizomicrobium sp.]|nr:glycosyltransferase family 2 protein [Rhizomicrobium sp.]